MGSALRLGLGVYGYSPSGVGVYGQGGGTNSIGVQATTSDATSGSTALLASNNGGGSNFTFGIKALAGNTSLDSAGIKGISGYGDELGDTTDCSSCFNAGVRGVTGTTASESSFGVLGISRTRGTGGIVSIAAGNQQARGTLGLASGATFFESTRWETMAGREPSTSSSPIRPTRLA